MAPHARTCPKDKDNPKRYWSFIKSLKSSSHVSPVLEWQGNVYKGDEERANCLNTCFAQKFCNPVVDVLPSPPILNSPGLDRFTIPRGRISLLLRELSVNKACGPDGLRECARILRECADVLAEPLHIICNLSVSTGVFPSVGSRQTSFQSSRKGRERFLKTTGLYPYSPCAPRSWRKSCLRS